MTRILVEVAIFGILVLGGLALWQVHDHNEIEKGIARQVAAEKAAVARQSQIDDRKLKAAGDAHAAEIAALNAQYAGIKPVRVRCYASTSGVPAAGVSGGESGPARNGPESNPMLTRDISGPLQLFARRLDTLNADARQLDAAIGQP